MNFARGFTNEQAFAVEALEKIFDNLTIYHNSFLPKFLRSKDIVAGLYIYGEVGVGKTFLTKKFFDRYSHTKYMSHYQVFMKNLHEKLNILYKTKTYDPVKELAKEIASEYTLLYIDELELRDIADVSLITKLVIYLLEMGVFVVFTSNTMPKNLYKDGIQRDMVLPLIAVIDKSFRVVQLSGQDLRKDISFIKEQTIVNFDTTHVHKDMSQLLKNGSILWPYHESNIQLFNDIVNCLTSNVHKTTKTLQLFGRELVLDHVYGNIAILNFDYLFESDMSSNDYQVMCECFHTIIIPYIPEISSEKRNVIVRFINFIDQAYLNRVRLVTILEKDLESIYHKNRSHTKELYESEFQRTISRLTEMSTWSTITK